MFSPITQASTTQSFDHKASPSDLMDRLWASRPKGRHGNELIHDYFQCLTGKPFSSQTSEIDSWIYEVLLAIESFEEEGELFGLLSGEKQQSSSIRKWLNRISGRMLGTAEVAGDKKQEKALEILLKNLGFDNTLSLLGRGYQLARQLKENEGTDWQKSEKTEKLFENLLRQLARQYDINPTKLTFDKKEVSPEFLSRSERANSNNTRRNQLIGGVALVALGIAYACVYNGYSPYSHFSSSQTLQDQGNPLITQPNQEIRQDLHQFNPPFEPPVDFTSKKISKLEINAPSTEEPEAGIWKNLNSFAASFWSQDGKSTSFHTSTLFYSINGVEMPFYDEAIKINLHNLHEMTEQEQQEVIEKFQLQSSIDLIGKEDFFKKLSEIDRHVLELANLVDLKFYSNESGLKYVLLNNSEFNELTLDGIKDISSNQKRIIIKRLEDTKKSIQSNIVENILQLPLVRFSALTGKEINQFIDSIPANIFSLLSNDQINGLDLSNASADQINNLFCRVIDTDTDKQRFALLPMDQVNKILDKLDNYQMYLISDEQMSKLNLSQLSEDHLNKKMFNNRVNTDTDKKRFALLPADQVNKILDKLDNYQMYLISDEQMSKLSLSQLSEDHLNKKMFNNRVNTDTDKKRFALLPADQVNKILDKIDNYQMYLISDNQFAYLDLSKFTEHHLKKMFNNRVNTDTDKKRFASLPADQVNKILDKLDNYQMYLISDNQFTYLDLSKFTEHHLKKMFNNRVNTETDKKRFALLPADQVNKILDKLDNYQMYLISDEQMSKLNLSQLSEDHLKKMFNNRVNTDTDKERFASLPADQVNKILDKLDNYQMYLISDEQMKKLDLSKLNEDHLKKMFSNRINTAEDKRRFALFSKDQVGEIVDKLNDYQMTLISKSQLRKNLV